MPELPEVETTRLGIAPHITGQVIKNVVVRNKNLRWPITATLKKGLLNCKFQKIDRRGKYLLCYTKHGCMMVHLGMSGSLHIVDSDIEPGKHDHLDIIFASGKILRFRDPRRFGSVIWTKKDPLQHKLIKHLGPEPLSENFNGEWLYKRSRKRTQAIKNFIMDSHNVVGVGNIYASESLFLAGINPKRKAGNVSLERYEHLTNAIKKILKQSIKQGGTTLRDFLNSDGRPGYFQQQLNVYARTGQPCPKCGSTIKEIKLGQRSSFYCPSCQT
ncbi:MAG: bifunctional DNA-formamidopyrimidine glycosylase/DNA-(apurinic or apyrimidinic site) lyase [Gammaproteobacteria bacterium]|jgi:formamidopyrimidine-DNA glycosylase